MNIQRMDPVNDETCFAIACRSRNQDQAGPTVKPRLKAAHQPRAEDETRTVGLNGQLGA